MMPAAPALLIGIAMRPVAAKMTAAGLRKWKSAGGTLIKLPLVGQAKMLKLFASVGADVASKNLKLAAAYKIITQAAKRAANTGN